MRVVLIDGYNVVHSTSRYKTLAESDLEGARARLIDDIAGSCEPGDKVIVVFDGAANPLSDGALHEIAGIGVVFSSFGISADDTIEQLAARHRAKGDEVVVVTSDQVTQWVTLGHGALRRSSSEYAEEIAEEIRDRGDLADRPLGSSRIAERIDPATRLALERWARGDKTSRRG